MGLVHKVVARESLVVESERVAEALAARDPRVMVAAKRALLDGMDLPLRDGLALEGRLALGVMRPGREDNAAISK
jgi:enoyl-CoA hydratase/carnithine racemase